MSSKKKAKKASPKTSKKASTRSSPRKVKAARPKGVSKRSSAKTSGKTSPPPSPAPSSETASSKPRGRGKRIDGESRRSPGTNPPKSPEAKHLGERIAYLRSKKVREEDGKPWTQKDLAKASGFSQPGIANIERGVAPPSDEAKKRIGEALGTEL